MEEIKQTITRIKGKMSKLDSNNPSYLAYAGIVSELERKLKPPKLRIHKAPEICDSCQ